MRAAPFVFLILLYSLPASVRAEESIPLFDGAWDIGDAWRHVRLVGETEYRRVTVDGREAVEARGRNSASMLVRRVEVDTGRCPVVTWEWRVDQVQPGADLTTRKGEDVAAGFTLLFGSPFRLLWRRPVPALRYVWSNDRLPAETVVVSPYAPEAERSIVLERGAATDWVTERRDVAADFTRAFGHPPPAPIQAVALFTDNDQTGEPVLAYYAWGRALCGAPGAHGAPQEPGR